MFERDWNVAGRDFVQTLEPRAFYVYVPYRNQSQAPVFDTALDDFNFGQLFSVNRYLGNDRIADANQLTLALSSRLIDPETGAERLRVAIGERFYFEDQRVVLNESPRSAATSDVLLGVEGRLSDAWSMIGLWQYNFDASQTERFNAGVRYTPAPGRVLNASYTYIAASTSTRSARSRSSTSSTSRRSGRSTSTGRCSGAGTTRSRGPARRWRGSRASSTMPAAGSCGSSASG